MEISEWEEEATEEELLDAIYEKQWTDETLQISREQCVDLVPSEEEGRLNFVNRFLSISQEIWAPVKMGVEEIPDEVREYRRSIGACYLCGNFGHMSFSKECPNAQQRNKDYTSAGKRFTRDNSEETAFAVASLESMGLYECPKYLASEMWHSDEHVIKSKLDSI